MRFFLLIFCGFILFSCQSKAKPVAQSVNSDTTEVSTQIPLQKVEKGIDLSLKNPTLVDIQKLDSSLKIDIKYATKDNFMGRVLYDSIDRIFLQKDVAEKLVKAQKFLKARFPDYSFLVYDGARPISVQQQMWDALDSIPPKERGRFLSNPANGGSLHNYGAAVDITIVDENGKPLDMGAPYDDIRKIAYPRLEQYFLKNGELTEKQIANRQLLRSILSKAGFYNITTEWWHFNSCTRQQAMKKYRLIL